jgi:hypothetical protein
VTNGEMAALLARVQGRRHASASRLRRNCSLSGLKCDAIVRVWLFLILFRTTPDRFERGTAPARFAAAAGTGSGSAAMPIRSGCGAAAKK